MSISSSVILPNFLKTSSSKIRWHVEQASVPSHAPGQRTVRQCEGTSNTVRCNWADGCDLDINLWGTMTAKLFRPRSFHSSRDTSTSPSYHCCYIHFQRLIPTYRTECVHIPKPSMSRSSLMTTSSSESPGDPFTVIFSPSLLMKCTVTLSDLNTETSLDTWLILQQSWCLVIPAGFIFRFKIVDFGCPLVAKHAITHVWKH